MSLPHNQKQADTDGDGLVDRKELEQMFDTDGDGVISAQEKIAAAKMFALVDKDGDGQLTEAEMMQVRPHSTLAHTAGLHLCCCRPRSPTRHPPTTHLHGHQAYAHLISTPGGAHAFARSCLASWQLADARAHQKFKARNN